MKDLEVFTKYLKTISAAQWETLFVLIPKIECANVFGRLIESKQLEAGSYTFPYWIGTEIITRTSNIIFQLDIMPVFDWMKWEEGRELLNSDNDFSSLDILTLCKLLTYIYRLNRFNEGALIGYFEAGTVKKILKALKSNIDKQ